MVQPTLNLFNFHSSFHDYSVIPFNLYHNSFSIQIYIIERYYTKETGENKCVINKFKILFTVHKSIEKLSFDHRIFCKLLLNLFTLDFRIRSSNVSIFLHSFHSIFNGIKKLFVITFFVQKKNEY